MKASKSIIWIMPLLVIMFLVVPQLVHPKTPDGLTPAVETICDEAGLTGAAWGLCNAYCEAMDCDSNPRASERACESVLNNFRKKTGGGNPPCFGGGIED